jgi:hypothetical protein
MSRQATPVDYAADKTAKAAWIAPQVEVVAAQHAENGPSAPGATFDGGIGYS